MGAYSTRAAELLVLLAIVGWSPGCGVRQAVPSGEISGPVGESAMNEFTSFDEFLETVSAGGSPEHHRRIVEGFNSWTAEEDFPLVEGTRVHFLYLGAGARSVSLPGDFNGWDPHADRMANVEGTDLWYLTKNFPADARLDYKFYVDGRWTMDTRNPRTMTGGFGPNSEIRMPAYEPPPEIEFRPGISHGTLESHGHENPATGDVRTLQVYLPPGYDGGEEKYPTLYVQDGSDYVSLGQINNVADFLIHEGRIRKVVMVCIPPVDRGREYSVDETYRDYVVRSVVPWVDARFRTIRRPEARGIMGASLGGLISAFIAFTHPETFGHCAGQSTYFGTREDRMIRMFEAGPRKEIRWYLDAGTYETGEGRSDLLGQNRFVRDLLLEQGYPLVYREYPEGHSWGNWKAHIDDILLTFWPAGS